MKVNCYHLVVALFFILLFLPLFDQVTGLLPEKRLAGVEGEVPKPTFIVNGWFEKDFQQQFETWFSAHIGLRSWMIRTANQINFTLSGETPSGSGTKVYLGKDNYLFEKAYVTAYNEPGQKEQNLLRDFTWRLFRLQELLEQHGVVLLLVLAPSKAEIYSEYLPEHVKKNARGQRLSHYQRMAPLLDEFGIHYIDVHKLFLQWKDQGAPPLFSRGGTHWNYYGAGRIVQLMLADISDRVGKKFNNIEVTSYTTDAKPFGTDNDLGGLLNQWSTNKINQGQIHPVFQHIPGEKRPNLLMIGDSFAFTLMYVLETQNLFERCDLMYYFKRRFSWPAGTDNPIDHSKLDLRQELLSRDAVIIEINEYWLPEYGFGLLRPAIIALEASDRKNN